MAHRVVHHALAGFAEGVASHGRGLALVPGGGHHAKAAEDTGAEAAAPVGKATFGSLAQDEVHQKHAVNRLGNRGTHEHQEREEGGLALGISLLPHRDGGHTGRSATKGRAHSRNAKRSCSTPIMTEQPSVVLSPARLAYAESLSGSR